LSPQDRETSAVGPASNFSRQLDVTAVTPREILARTLWGGEDRSGGEKGMEAGAQRLLSDTLWPSRVRVPHTRQRYDPAVFSKLRRPFFAGSENHGSIHPASTHAVTSFRE
jgi:hypothetical protein